MTGIIINDSIVLITQIDEYGTDRGAIPSIIDGASDRLRAVFLTTATTVLGLAPLLYERSADAQFLKPTVLTLVYGLGFGMLLVLLVVPSLVAVQHDLARYAKSTRRGLSLRAAPARRLLQTTFALTLIWFATTLGRVLVTGSLPKALQLTGWNNAQDTLALLLFLSGAGAITLTAYGLGALATLRARTT
jgi:hypothetical protein